MSNVWSCQLDCGQPLDALVSRAVAKGAGVVELRQGSLGGFEDRKRSPDVAGLTALTAANKETQFIPSFEVPFLDDEVDSDHPSFAAGRALAVAVAGSNTPHLRLVDLETQAAAAGMGSGLARLGSAMAEVDGLLSVENAGQGWRPLWKAFGGARVRLGDRAATLRVCVDPCNLSWLGADEQDPARLLQMLPASDVGMIHCKQQVGGSLQPTVGSGVVDWRLLLETIATDHPTAPFLFEMAASSRMWEYLHESLEYLHRLAITDN